MASCPPTCTCGVVFKIYSTSSGLIEFDERLKMYTIRSSDGIYTIRHCFGCGESLFTRESKELDEEILQGVSDLSKKITCLDDVISNLGQPDFLGNAIPDTQVGRTLIYNNVWPELTLNFMERSDGSIQFTYAIK